MLQPDNAFYQSLQESDTYLECVGDRIWLMDNHRWAYWIWEKHRAQRGGDTRFDLLHFDFHFDALNDFHDQPSRTAELQSADLQQIFEWVSDPDPGYIRFDSFIAPALHRGLLGDVHFFCLEDDYERGFYGDLPEQYGARQFFYDSVEAAARAAVRSPYIFDLCLDLFNSDNEMMHEGTPWPPDQIANALTAWRPLITGADLITISLSFGYSGTPEHTRQLASQVIPAILKMRVA